MWLEEPDELNRLGYDISKISIWAINQEKNFVELIKENYNKFSIIGNKYNFFMILSYNFTGSPFWKSVLPQLLINKVSPVNNLPSVKKQVHPSV